MKQYLTLFCLLSFALISTLSGHPTQAQETTDVPFVYYYSNVLDAFIIERADGSDSRIFGPNLMPDGVTQISGPGWSPSGEWFEWEGRSGPSESPVYTHVVLNVDGTRQLGGLDEFVVYRLAWSPNPDLLMVVGYVGTAQVNAETNLVTMTLRTTLIDLTTETPIFTYDDPDYVIDSVADGQPTEFDPNAGKKAPNDAITAADGQPPRTVGIVPSLFWTPDGQYAMLRKAHNTYGVDGTIAADGVEYVYQVFDHTGEVHQIAQPELIPEKSGEATGIRNAKIAYLPADDPNTLIIKDLLTEHATAVDLTNLDNLAIQYVTFSPNGDAALFVAQDADCEASCINSVWLWRDGDSSLGLILEASDYQSNAEAPNWSADGAYALLVGSNFIPYILDVEVGSINPIEGATEARFWAWYSPSHVLLEHSDYSTIYAVDVATSTLVYTLTRHSGASFYEIGALSPDGSAYAYVGEIPVILDLATGAEIVARPDGRSYFSLSGGNVNWSADGEWLLVNEEALIAGGSAPRWTSIVKRDGTMRRELGQINSPTAFGWLPENVDVSRLPAAQSPPIFPLPSHVMHSTDWSFIVSWSPDGTQLVRGAINIGGVSGPSTLFDVESGQAIAELDPMDLETHTVEWLENDDESYSPQIIERSIEAWQVGGWIFGTSPDGSRVGVYVDGTLTIYDAATDEMLYSQDRLAIAAFSFTPDNALLAITSPYQPTQILNGNTWEVLLTFNTHATAVAFSPDGQTLAIANSWDIELYDVNELLATTD